MAAKEGKELKLTIIIHVTGTQMSNIVTISDMEDLSINRQAMKSSMREREKRRPVSVYQLSQMPLLV